MVCQEKCDCQLDYLCASSHGVAAATIRDRGSDRWEKPTANHRTIDRGYHLRMVSGRGSSSLSPLVRSLHDAKSIKRPAAPDPAWEVRQAGIQIDPYRPCSSVFFMAVSDFCRVEADRSTATMRTIEPLNPVKPACSDPMILMRYKPRGLGSDVSEIQNVRSSAV